MSIFDFLVRRMRTALVKQIRRPPRIAFIGEAGVGKTSTVNALFRTELATADPDFDPEQGVGHTISIQAKAVEWDVETPRGLIVTIDMPGLGESMEATRSYLKLYRDKLPRADVILWVLDNNRQWQMVQHHLQDVRSILSRRAFDRIVFCINKVDRFKRGSWLEDINQPDAERTQVIDEYVNKTAQVLGLDPQCVIPYSATLYYNLDSLLAAMYDAIPSNRRPALSARANPHSPVEKMRDPHYRQLAESEMAIVDGLLKDNGE